MTQHLTERSVRFLKNASEVPRLYRRTNKVELYAHVIFKPSRKNQWVKIWDRLGKKLNILFGLICFEMWKSPTSVSYFKNLKVPVCSLHFPLQEDAQCFGLNFICSLINRKCPPEPQPIWTTHFSHSISWSPTPKMWWKTPSSRSGSGSHSQTAPIGKAERNFYDSEMSS